MSHDMLMLRGDVKDGFNLAVGEPVFLQKWMNNLPKRYLTPSDTRYPPFIGIPSLLEELGKYHEQRYKWFVVTVGAKQALVASFYALSQQLKTERVHTPAPYWPSYPTLVKSAGLQFQTVRSRPVARDIIVNTSPNNPDGSCSGRSCDIWDAAYAHPVYGFDWEERLIPAHRVAVFSAAKLFGLSGLRIGWLATNDEKLARLAAEYVEKATSGVSTLDQYALEGVLRRSNEGRLWKKYLPAMGTLGANRSSYQGALQDHIEDHAAETGMFAWFRAKNPEAFEKALVSSNVRLIPGNACGWTPDFYRMSLGHEAAYTQNAMSALQRQLEK